LKIEESEVVWPNVVDPRLGGLEKTDGAKRRSLRLCSDRRETKERVPPALPALDGLKIEESDGLKIW